VPEGWEIKQLKDVAALTMGQSPKSEYYNSSGEGLPFHQGVTDFGFRFVSHKKFSSAGNRIAEPGDILCSVRAPVGRLNRTVDKIILGRGLASIRSKAGYQSHLYYQLRNHFFQEDIIGGGAIFASVTKKLLSEQGLLTPPENIIKQYEKISAPIDQQILNLTLQNQKLKAARDLLLPKLMNGEIPV
jgi:type I restriction enzyme S subunit